VTRLRLAPLALLVAALLGVVAIAARGRPLGGGGSGGEPSASFLNYVYTSLVIVVFGMGALFVVALLTNRSAIQPTGRRRRNRLAAALFFTVTALLFWGLVSSHLIERLRHAEKALNLVPPPAKNPRGSKLPREKALNAHGAQLRWEEVAVVLALLGALGVGVLVARRRRGVPASWHLASQAAVSAALNESLDDLRSEPDIRKAIIAAYARMEQALALAGLPRRPSEAPLEYVERALGELDTSEDAVRRLTDLFEWAKFSHHEPEPSMRDEAIDALSAVRDELRAPSAETVTA
jgi:hypothetical protein